MPVRTLHTCHEIPELRRETCGRLIWNASASHGNNKKHHDIAAPRSPWKRLALSFPPSEIEARRIKLARDDGGRTVVVVGSIQEEAITNVSHAPWANLNPERYRRGQFLSLRHIRVTRRLRQCQMVGGVAAHNDDHVECRPHLRAGGGARMLDSRRWARQLAAALPQALAVRKARLAWWHSAIRGTFGGQHRAQLRGADRLIGSHSDAGRPRAEIREAFGGSERGGGMPMRACGQSA